MSGLIVFISHFKVKEGKLDELPSDQAMAILTPPEDSEITLNQMPQLMGGYIRLNAK